jgi:retron-type reverse transcriptase
MGNVSIDLSLANIWQSWKQFKRGKKSSEELERFSYYLEKNLYKLYADLNVGKYKHSGYKKFIVTDSKRREISVASIRDRIIHRLLYEYLYEIYDKTFIYDVWSCRKGKGLFGAIERTQKFLSKYDRSFVWRADIKKFFDNVNHQILIEILDFKIADNKARRILREVINSYSVPDAMRERERERVNTRAGREYQLAI